MSSFGVGSLIFFLFFLFFTILGVAVDGSWISIICAFIIYFMVGASVEKKSAIHMMFFLGYTTFVFLAMLLNWYYLDVEISLYFYTSIIALFFLIWTKETKVNEFIDYGKKLRFYYFVYCIVACPLLVLHTGLASPVFGFLIFFMAMCLRQNCFSNYYILAAFSVPFFFYMGFVWNGFGRTVTFGWLILAILIFLYSRHVYINKYFFAMVPGLASILVKSRNLFKLSFDGLESSLGDSAFSPYRLATTFSQHAEQSGLDVSGFVEQMVFVFFVFIPRSIWPDKPYGFGFEYTVRHLERYLIESGHSVASTLIGDHLYYLGFYGIFSSLVLFAVIAWGTRYLYRIKGLNGNGVLVFAASMMVLSWGGATSFSARVIMPLMFFLLIVVLFKNKISNRFDSVFSLKEKVL